MCPVCQATDEEADHGEVDEGFHDGGQVFVIDAQAALVGEPGEGPLGRPALGRDREAPRARGRVISSVQPWAATSCARGALS
jgi:hypothetical protein